MDIQESRLVRETIEFPVRYDKAQQTIWDSKGMMVCDIKGWGRIQYMGKSEERQDAIGHKIANLLNQFEEMETQQLFLIPDLTGSGSL